MANKQTIITVTHGNEAYQTAKDLLLKPSSKPRQAMVWFSRFFDAVSLGNRSAKVAAYVTTGDQTTATGTFTFSGISTANDTILVNGVTFTAVASGATNNQFNVGTTATTQAANLVSAINASTTALVSGTVTASNLAGVVTVTAKVSGQVGNAITIAKGTDAGTVCTVSGARLTGGADPTTVSTTSTFRAGV